MFNIYILHEFFQLCILHTTFFIIVIFLKNERKLIVRTINNRMITTKKGFSYNLIFSY